MLLVHYPFIYDRDGSGTSYLPKYLKTFGIGFHQDNKYGSDGTIYTGAVAAYISSHFGIDFFSRNTLAMRISWEDQNVGIGTAEPKYKLHVSNRMKLDGSQAGVWIEAGGTDWFVGRDNNNSELRFYYGGNRFKFRGDGVAFKSSGSGGWIGFSDKRLKKDIEAFTLGLDAIEKIQPIYYRYNDVLDLPSDQLNVGIIAQELQEVAPFMVSNIVAEDSTEYLAVDPSAFDYIIINAIKEQQTIIRKMQNELEDQRQLIKALRKKK